MILLKALIFFALLLLISYFISKTFKSKNTSNRKPVRYLVNTILFVVLCGLMFLPIAKFSFDTGSTSLPIIGGIVAIIISYKLVKKINKSNLWARLFDKNVAMNDVTEDKSDTIEENQNKKANNISELADDLTKLNELKEKGILTEEEFNEEKKKLLKQ